jgi:hypothetical protein
MFNQYRFAINTRLQDVIISHDGEIVEELSQQSEKQIANLRDEYEGCIVTAISNDSDKVLARYMPEKQLSEEQLKAIPSMKFDAGKIDPECKKNGTFMVSAEGLEAIEEVDNEGNVILDKNDTPISYLYPVVNGKVWSSKVQISQYHPPKKWSHQQAPRHSENAKRWSVA